MTDILAENRPQKNSSTNSFKAISKKYRSFLHGIWNGQKPLAKLFRTARRGYIYDTGTNKIMGCDDLVFELLQNLYAAEVESAVQKFFEKHGQDALLHATESILQSIENQNILKFKSGETFKLTGDKCDVDELIREHLEMMTFEVTDKCNLRCAYCVYNPWYNGNRNHGTKEMSREVLKKALMHLKDHSPKEDKVALSFYGGEPLLCFDTIKWCVGYAKRLFEDKGIDFSITTNGTLITPKIADFFKENDFLVLVSIDGPEQITDSFRRYKDGKGSFRDSMRGLKYLVEEYGDLAEKKLKLSMVYTPPFSGKRLDEIDKLWTENKWIPPGLGATITYPEFASVPRDAFNAESQPEDKTLMEWAFEKFRTAYINKSRSSALVNSAIEPSLNAFLQRPLYKEPERSINLNGCCVPGARRLYVTVDGNFGICERVESNSPRIGNVHAGLDIEALKTNYISQYMDVSFPDCSTCWAARLCNLCYRDACKDGIMTLNKKSRSCKYVKNSKEKYLQYFCTLMEDDPYGLDYLLERKIK